MKGIVRIYVVLYNSKHQGAVESFNGLVQNLLVSIKNHQKY